MEGIRLHLSNLRTAWADFVLLDKTPDPALLVHPLKSSHPISENLTRLLFQDKSAHFPPMKEECPPLPFEELCQLSLLRELGKGKGKSLGQKLLPFCPYPTLWSRENTYHAKEAKISSSLLQRAFGSDAPHFDPPDPYFKALEKKLPSWSKEEESSECPFGFVQKGKDIDGAFALQGIGVSLGAMRADSVEIPAFGPQIAPLNDPSGFGIYRLNSESKWAALNARKEIWFETIPSLDQNSLEIRFIGAPVERNLFFVFYIKAEMAIIAGDRYLPQSLQRYAGDVKGITFEKKKRRLLMESQNPSRMELIPLAGGNCFWGSDFLLGFEVPSHDGRMVFRFH